MKKILVADDDPQFADIIVFLLRKEGYAVDVAANEPQVLNRLSQTNYDVILQDVFFPDKDRGLNLLKKMYDSIRENNTILILITSMPIQLFEQEENINDYLQISQKLLSKTENQKAIVEGVKEALKAQNNSSTN